MRKIYFDEDVDLAPLKNRVIGVIGYGNQGSAQARNLRDSGLEVIVGNRRDAYYQEAQGDGFPVFSIARATARADLVLVGLPDEVQQQVYERHMQKHIRGRAGAGLRQQLRLPLQVHPASPRRRRGDDVPPGHGHHRARAVRRGKGRSGLRGRGPRRLRPGPPNRAGGWPRVWGAPAPGFWSAPSRTRPT